MLLIQKKEPPAELVELKNEAARRGLSPKEAYKLLHNPLKGQVTAQLMEEQGHLCAYCMRRIPDERVPSKDIADVSIEHWLARDPKSGEDRGQGLDYSNFLAVCSGNCGPKGQRNKRDLTCDAKRGNRDLTINPLDPDTLKSIFYRANGEIATSDPSYEDDLLVKLNLNCVSTGVMLPLARKNVLDSVQADVIQNSTEENRVQYCQHILNCFESESDPKTPYIGIAIWWLRTYIKDMSGNVL